MTDNDAAHEKIREERERAQKEKDRLEAAEQRRLDDEKRWAPELLSLGPAVESDPAHRRVRPGLSASTSVACARIEACP